MGIGLPPSYANGFAPRDFSPQYPELWTGCIGAWCPSLGPSGAQLLDWSGRNNHGTLTNFTLSTGWAHRGGKAALLADGADDYVTMGDITALNGTQKMCLSIWVQAVTLGSVKAILGKFNGASGWILETSHVSFSATDDILFAADPSNYGYTTAGGLISTTGQLTHIFVAYDGSQGSNATKLRVWSNGVQRTLTFNGTIPTTLPSTNTNDLCIARRTGDTFQFNAYFDDAMIWTRDVSPFVPLLYSGGYGRGIAYTPRDTFPYTAASTGNRRRRVLITAGA